ncbi:hypothetical protein LTR66_005752 [Elasticomyces elasticus]|nr:hypothetical protein LTR66_005752 [Elasticomyces elasticus]
MTTIRIDDTPHPGKANGGASSSAADGVYPMRRLSKTQSLDRRSTISTGEEAEDEDAGLRRAGDYKHKQTFSGKYLLWLSYQSIGVIYGDIGTSPLYVFSSTFSSPPSYNDLVGALSLVIWSLIMIVTVKYVLVILRADNDGEGGTFSTYALLSRYANITSRDPREASLTQMRRYRTGDLGAGGEAVRSGFEHSRVAQTILKVVGCLAVTMVLSDGVLTPAQSVLGAVQGLEVVVPNISHSAVVGATCGILILLFLIQPLGISKIATAFAPIILIWLALNAVFGIYNLAKFDHSILKAFSPAYAFEYLIRNKADGWRSLGGILLSFTGVEALYADLGAFSARAIQLSWLCYCFPCLLLAYTGQAAYIAVNPNAYTNPFFNAAPPGTVIFSLIVAVLAAIVASQAIITASFQLITQIQKLSYFPQIKIVHVSKVYHGQVYVPLANWLLMIGTVLIAAIFNNTTALGNAYGVCVMFVTFFDTCMVTLAAILVWRFSPFLVFLPWLTIALLDGTFLSSALTKVPVGAWFTITLASLLACILLEWRFGKEQQWKAEAADRFPTSHFVRKNHHGQLQLTDKFGGTALSSIKGLGIFFDKAGETTPLVFSAWVSKVAAVPESQIFFHMRPLETPSVTIEERYNVSRLALGLGYRVVLRHGYNDNVITPDLGQILYEQVRAFVVRTSPSQIRGDDSEDDRHHQDSAEVVGPTDADPTNHNVLVDALSMTRDKVSLEEDSRTALAESEILVADAKRTKTVDYAAEMRRDLARLDAAYNHQVLYIIGKEELKVKPGTGIIRSILLKAFLWMRENSRSKVADLRIPTDRIIEVGFVKEV